MKYTCYILAIVLLIIMACSHTEDFHETLICYRGGVQYGEYWWSVFTGERDSMIEIEFESDTALDLFLLNTHGFNQFKRRIGYDLIVSGDWFLGYEEYGTCTLVVQSDDSIRFATSVQWDSTYRSVDIFLYNSYDYYMYQQGIQVYGYVHYFAVEYLEFHFHPAPGESLFLVVDNTSLHGSPPEGPTYAFASAYHYTIEPFSYIIEGSMLNTCCM